MLVDCDGPNGTSGPDHSLDMEEGKRSFSNTMAQAIRRGEAGDTSTFSSNEEWSLSWHDDGGEPGAWPIFGDGARHIRSSLMAAIRTLIRKVENKFSEKWADRHVFVLDSTVLGPDGLVAQLVREEVARRLGHHLRALSNLSFSSKGAGYQQK